MVEIGFVLGQKPPVKNLQHLGGATALTLKSEQTLAERANKGEFSLVEPLDYHLLSLLPEVGTMFANMYPLGETVSNIAKKMPKHEGQAFPPKIVFGRIRSMEIQGLVSQTKGGTSQRIWQRTQRGTKLFKEWKEKSGATSSK